MNISYGEPLSKGWDRMRNALFNPFDPGKWFTVGFTAFLAGLADGPGFGNGTYRSGNGNWNFGNIAGYPKAAWEWMAGNPVWFILISLGIILLIAIGIIILWLSSRGKFMFLDNVVHDRALVSKPWDKFKNLGNSLFLWRFWFGIILFAVICLFVLVIMALSYYFQGNNFSGLAAGLTIAGMSLWLIALFIITGYISLFLSHFIVPIMYKNNIGAVQAWRRFISLFSTHMLHFILYGIIIFLISVAIFFCVAVIGLLTCCIGFLILGIPYIGTVVLLPVTYTFRALSVEFLEQFGPEYEIFPRLNDNDLNGVYRF